MATGARRCPWQQHQRRDGAEDEPKALALVQKAQSLASGVTARERAYIDALATRYTGKADGRQAADRSFADAMRAHEEIPARPRRGDDFCRVAHGPAAVELLDAGREPQEGTEEAVATLERVIASNPKHPGALHYWIHLWEPTKNPGAGREEADRLLPLMLAPAILSTCPRTSTCESDATPMSSA